MACIMKNSSKAFSLPTFVPALLVGMTLIGGLEESHAVNSAASGNWAEGTTWSGGVAPGAGPSAVTAVILGGNAVTVNTTVPSVSGVTTLVVGNSANSVGSLLITTGGSLAVNSTTRVMAANNIEGAVGIFTMTGGSATFGGQFTAGLGTTGQTGNGSGTVNLSGASSLTITNNVIIGSSTQALGTGNVNITGSSVNFSSLAALTVNQFGNLNFTFDSIGISDYTVTGVATFNASSHIVVNAGSFVGAGTFTLIDAASFTGTPIITLNGFEAGSSYNWDTTTGLLTVNVTAVPEPSTYTLLALGAGLVIWQVRRRRVA
jgi:PEP-CTERM motif